MLAAIGAIAAVLLALPRRFTAIPEEAAVVNPGPTGEAARRGRAAFYGEALGGEALFSETVAVLAGPLRPWPVLRALLELRGAGTRNLRVELAEDATIGGRTFARGATIDTGLDVAAGSWVPLGVTVEVTPRLAVRVGFTCALCHATVDPETMRVIHGAANRDLRIGLILALARGSAALREHGDGASADEVAVDRVMSAWPPGSFDARRDGVAEAVRIPEVFGRGVAPGEGHPFAGVTGEVATSAWLAGVAPPEVAVDADAAALGRLVFVRAGCERCHADDVEVRGGRGEARAPGLVGLWWRAPYLRDGGLAVGTGEAIVGAGALADRGGEVDPRGCLRALIDRELRGRVVAANRADEARWRVGVRGVGHAFWVDPPAGFSLSEQRALVEYLLSLRP